MPEELRCIIYAIINCLSENTNYPDEQNARTIAFWKQTGFWKHTYKVGMVHIFIL